MAASSISRIPVIYLHNAICNERNIPIGVLDSQKEANSRIRMPSESNRTENYVFVVYTVYTWQIR